MLQIDHFKKFRKLIPGRCQSCGTQIFSKHGGRPRKFCNRGCQQRDFRHARHLDLKRDERCQNSRVVSKVLKPDFADQPPAFEVLGNGHRWARNRVEIDRRLVREIIATEIPERTNPTPVEIPANDRWRIPNDLLIPQFLRRVQS
jgi:hypothetical protein